MYAQCEERIMRLCIYFDVMSRWRGREVVATTFSNIYHGEKRAKYLKNSNAILNVLWTYTF
jgi:hypothetical protein